MRTIKVVRITLSLAINITQFKINLSITDDVVNVTTFFDVN